MNIRFCLTILSICTLFVACSDEPIDPGGIDATVGVDTVNPDTSSPDTTTCTPECANKACGDDGCGGSCGSCVGGTACTDAGQCEASCIADCNGKNCGGDGCGSFCGQCGVGEECTADGVCEVACVPQCEGKTCGDDGCGNQCGQCAQGETCNNGVCEGEVQSCGDITYEGCCDGTIIKYCLDGELIEGDCAEAPTPTCGWSAEGGYYECGKQGADPTGTHPLSCDGECVPDCSGKFCGDDGCGDTCGQCDEGETCNDDFQCEGGECVPDCGGKECGPDGCGGTCGADCGFGFWCDAFGQCNECVPQCDGKSCGPDSCGGTCGTCDEDASCDDGQCIEGPCVADCDGKVCGSDGCGGTCGECDEGLTCAEGACVEGAGCAGQCGQFTAGGTCQCDDFCFLLGDCCEDVCTTCADIFTEQCCKPSCDGKQCGDDGCGGTCGEPCAEGSYCNDEFQCIEDVCEAQCEGKQCGDDGCGGTCGACGDNQGCDESGQCIDSAPTLTGTWIRTYTFEEEQAPYLNCQLNLNLSSVGASAFLCANCDFAWEVLVVKGDTDCGEWMTSPDESTTQFGIDLADKTLYFYSQELADWVAWEAPNSTVVGNMFTGSDSTGFGVYYADMNESGGYDEGEGLDIGEQIGLTWAN